MDKPVRKLQRLQGFDYASQRYYFVTICCHEKNCLFGFSEKLNQYGEIAKAQLTEITNHFDGVSVDKFVVMPNHVHAIIVIGCDGAERSRPFPTLSTIIGQYKSGVSRCIHMTNPNIKVWQKSFHDHVIRNENDYLEIWRYIDTNPAKWTSDCFYIDERTDTP